MNASAFRREAPRSRANTAVMVAIFLKNRLVSCDAILPLAMEVAQENPRADIRFYVSDRWSFDAIRVNTILAEAIDSIGCVRCLGPSSESRWRRVGHKIAKAWWLLWFLARYVTRRVHVVHFGAVNRWPLRLIYVLNPKRTYFAEGEPWPASDAQRAVVHLRHPERRERARRLLEPASRSLIAYSETWPYLSKASAGRPVLRFPGPHLRPVWMRFLMSRSPEYIERELDEWQRERVKDGIFVHILGYFGELDELRHPMGSIDLARQTFEVLMSDANDRLVFVKPHIYTDGEILNELLEPYRDDPRLIVTNLHPQLLASRALALIANVYSTTFGDARAMGAATIEFTDYSDAALRTTGGGSMNPDYVSHFINRDTAALRHVIEHLRSRRPTPPSIPDSDPRLPDVIRVLTT